MPSGRGTEPGPQSAAGSLERQLCRVGGVNLNYSSRSGALYHVQIEDRGPVPDAVSESQVRRINVIIYSNYGEPNARIIHGRDHDFEDVRTPEYNKEIEQRVQSLAGQARDVVENWEERRVAGIKGLLRRYYVTKDEGSKREIEAANTLHPFVFSRAWRELKEERARPSASAATEPAPSEVVYPLDPELRERVLDIERVIAELEGDVLRLKDLGIADDILVQTCRKMVARAKETLSGGPSEFSARRLEMTRGSLVTTLRQVRSRLKSRLQPKR